MCDIKSLRKVADEDLIAIDAAYHVSCLSSYYRHAESAEKSSSVNKVMLSKTKAFDELIMYINEKVALLEASPWLSLQDSSNNA